jgi:hypothetical protein
VLKYKIRFRKRYDIINNSIGKEYVFNRSESQYKMISGMPKSQFVVLLSVLIGVATILYVLNLTQQDAIAQRQQIPGIKYNTTNTSTRTLSNATVMPDCESDTKNNNKDAIPIEPCDMPCCPPGEMCIQMCPETCQQD